jgi:hypothetical protein
VFFQPRRSLKKKIAGELRCGSIIARMAIDMNEARLTTIEQVEQFLHASTSVVAPSRCRGKRTFDVQTQR